MVAWFTHGFTWCDDGERRAAHVGCTRAARGLHGVLHGEHDGEHGGGREGRHLPPLQERLRVLANISAIEAISLVGEDSICRQLSDHSRDEVVHMERDDVGKILDPLLGHMHRREAWVEDLKEAPRVWVGIEGVSVQKEVSLGK